MSQAPVSIGRVIRCSTRGFVGAVRLPEPELPAFGSFCQAEAQQGKSQVIGLVYDISIEDDAFARQVATAESPTQEQLADTQRNRQVPVEFSALTVGYRRGETFVYSLPPQPPLTLAAIHTLGPEDVCRFTDCLDFLALIFGAAEIPGPDLAAAALRAAAQGRPESERRRFLLQAGRECARLLSDDLNRLDSLLRRLGA